MSGDLVPPVLAVMLLLTPALGATQEELLQDTLKSAIVSFGALIAAGLFFWHRRKSGQPLRWHGVMWLPLMLMAYALGSMAWSHAYLGGVEAIRWFIFALLLWLGLNTFRREGFALLAWGVHAGAVAASLWAALQFWMDLRLFPQGPMPASTFVNRNFFAEFAVCALPLGVWLLLRARRSATVALLAISNAFVVTAVMMTGTRSALVTLGVQLLVALPLIAGRCRGQLAWPAWSRGTQALALGLLLATVAGLGSLPTGNARIAAEQRGLTAIERAVVRTSSIVRPDESVGMRVLMWKDTFRMAMARPVTGVGAGAWESEIPLYQSEGTQLENDYYAHNEILQLLAEYGLAGWAFLLGLLGYLGLTTWRTWRAATDEEKAEAPVRAMALCSLMGLLLVCNAGFPWRLAATGALFAVALAVLAASDARLGYGGFGGVRSLPWQPRWSPAALALLAGSTVLAAYITQQAVECEYKIVRATRLALAVTASGQPNAPRWQSVRAEVLTLIKQGTDINRHYRKITPMVADELARWGDWRNAIWVWESVLSSRPHVAVILSNVARGYGSLGDWGKAREYVERAKKIQPRAPAVMAAEAVVLSRTGQEVLALQIARDAVDREVADYDLVNLAFTLGWRHKDYPLALRAMALRMKLWPATRPRGLLQLGFMYVVDMQDGSKALGYFRQGLAAASTRERESLIRDIPPNFWPRLQDLVSVPPSATQTSASSK